MKEVTTSEDDSNLLVLILDTNPFVWQQSANSSTPFSLDEALQQILVFINAHLALKYDNQVVVIASHAGHSQFLYPHPHDAMLTHPAPQTTNGNSKRDANMYPHFQIVTDQIVQGLKDLLSDTSVLQKESYTSSMISGAFSMALCYINRVIKLDDVGHIKPRICILSVSPDASQQYISLMNCIFSAQKMALPVDVCRIFGDETAFLQQAASITGGIYVKADNPRALLQYLLFTFLPERYARNYLNLPSQDQVDYRAACFCHKNIVDIGFVCSVCLSIFCTWTPVCSTCKTKFSFKPKGKLLSGRSTPRTSAASTPITN
ncbi:TFIIH subunit Tfb4/p34 [Gongronella butleri]|nr:TFIIH subunit Tfb4/p34 [Gongronella butleri]